LSRRGDTILRIAAAREQSADPVADGKLFDALAQLHDNAGSLKSDKRRSSLRWGICTLTLSKIGAVESRRLDLDQHFSGRRPR
jgi:hypothetical protein